MKKTIAVLPGDGIGPEVTEAAIIVLKKIAVKFGHRFGFVYADIGDKAIEKTGSPLPDQTLAICKKSDAILFGAIGNPKYDLDPKAKIRPEQGLLDLRKKLGLWANLRPIKIYPQLYSSSPIKNERLENVDLIVVRELTGGIYFGKPRLRKNRFQTAIDTSVYSKFEIIRVAQTAFELAEKRKKKITSVDKANVLETSRLWRETVTEISNKFKKVTLEHMFVDNAAMQLIKRPGDFDVILTENLFGDILTDEAGGVAGSIGLLPSASLGEKTAKSSYRYGLYEPIHGAFNKAEGKNIANPIGAILSAGMLLDISFRLENEARTIDNAVEKSIAQGFRTRDIMDKFTPSKKILGTDEMGRKIAEYL